MKKFPGPANMNSVSYLVLVSLLAVAISAETTCFQCTSNDNPSCTVNDVGSLAPFKQVCPLLGEGPMKGAAAIGCRKTIQNVEEDEVVVRECAYSGENVDGLKKSGNHAIKLFHYQCTNAKEDTPCNFGTTTFATMSSLIAIFIALMRQ
ncbi:unnamed protein product [Caenorhabditis auriculariae]|uniref:Protein sleepless n=1 Tax=Caenorhabditis auriculariae TaxID=2777116 RepID=A0A8S1HLU7_9PELO|nr:unnamed protein product [Caenorhabditis auriculariae]